MKKTKRLWAWFLTLMLCVGAIDFTGLSAYAAEDEEAITLENDGESGYDKVVVIDEENPTGIEEDDFLEENTTYTLGLLQGCTAYRDPYYKTKIPDGTKISVPNALYLNTPTPDRKVFDCYAIGLGNGSPNLVEVTMVTEVRKNIYPVHDPKAYFLIPDYSSWSDEYKNMTMLYIQPIYKDAPGPFIDEVNINVTTPKSGKSPSFTATTDNEDCMIQDGKVTWTDVKTNKTLTESSKFEAGKQYLATILLNPYDTYTIDSYTNVYINGNKAEFKGSVSEGTYKFTYEFRVDVVNVTVTEPVDGAHPDFTATTDSELCTVMDGNVSWYDETLNHFMTADEKYKLGGTYSARIWLTKKDGYTIGKKTEVYINGKEATYSNATSDSAMFYYDFSLEPVKYDLWVGGKQVTEINQNDILGDGKASFNPSTNTLTLNNLNGTIGLVADTYENTCAIYSKGIDNLTITGTADLSKNTGDFAIEALSGNITFKNADLKLKGKAVAIKADKITFDGGTIDAESAADSEGGAAIAADDIILNKGTVKTSIDGQLVDGIHVKTMTVNGGLLDVTSNGASCTGICVENSLTLNSGEINANAYDMDDYAYGLTGKYGGSTKLTVKGGKLYSYGSYAGVINFDGGITLAKGIGITKPADGKLDDGKTKVVNKDGVIPSEVEISAEIVTYTVTFDLNGKSGTPPTAQIIEKGGKVTKPSDPDVLAATFTGWYTDKACKKAYDFDTPVTKDFTLYAGWKEIKKYTVTFSANGKTATNMPDPQEVEEGEYVKMPLSDPKAEGFTFGGWYKEASCKNLFDSSTPIKSDTTIYAKWIAESTETFTVTFDLNGKGMGIPAPQKVEKGKKAKKPTDPEAEGFTFTGWYTESACKNKYIFSTAVTADITLYAGWEEVEPVPLPDPIYGGRSALDSVPRIEPGVTTDLYLVKGQKFNIGQGWYVDKADKASKKIVSISKKGVFTAKAVGYAVIKCGAGETATQLTVHISKPKMEKKSLKLELTAEDAFRTEQINLSYDSANLKVLWHSANPDVVTVDNTGKVTTVGKGSSKVTAYINGSAYTCKVTVKEKVGLLDHTVHLAKGASKTISIKGLKKPVWEASKDGIVTIKKNKITGIAAGRTVLSYTQDDKTYRVMVIVEDIALSGEGLKEQGKAGSNKYTIDSLKVGDDTDLFFKDVDQSVVFKSSKPGIAFIDENQNVVIRGTGKAKFTAKVDGKSITINVTVK